jgi:hypothetical protein
MEANAGAWLKLHPVLKSNNILYKAGSPGLPAFLGSHLRSSKHCHISLAEAAEHSEGVERSGTPRYALRIGDLAP